MTTQRYVIDYQRPTFVGYTVQLRLLHTARGRTVVYTDREVAEASARALYRGQVYAVDDRGFTTKQRQGG